MNEIMKIINPFDEGNKEMFAKLYVDSGWFEELLINLPNDLVDKIFQNSQDITFDDVLNLVDLVGNAIPDIGEFPFRLNFSLVNEGVVELDSIFSNNTNGNIKDIYKPYFYEFTGYCKYEEFIKLITYYKMNKYKYFTCFLDFSQESEYGNKDIIAVINGNVLFSASPIIEKNAKLVIVPNTPIKDKRLMAVLDDTIYQCNTKPIDISENYILKNAIDNELGISPIPQYIKVFNVGQANNIYIELSNNNHIFFDVGITKSRIERNQEEVKYAIEEYSKLKANMVILSHWDIDHILGVAYADKSIYDALWIVPDLWGLMKYKSNKNGNFKFKYISDSAKRLLKYLDYRNNNRLIIIDEGWIRDCIYSSQNKNIFLWTGERKRVCGKNKAKKPYSISEANNFGLILTMKNNKNILLSGDCEYSVMPSAIWNVEYDYLVAAHHCSKMSKIPLNKSNRNKRVILSYGVNNNYGHPDNQQILELDKIGYQIVSTLGHRHIRCNLK